MQGTLVDWFCSRGHAPGSVAVLRPDRFVYGVVAAADASRLVQALNRELQCAGAGDDRSGGAPARHGLASRQAA